MALIPPEVPAAQVLIPHDGPLASLAALYAGLCIVAVAGEARGIDPGRPGVPAFGRRIYHLGIPPDKTSRQTRADLVRSAAIKRKLASVGLQSRDSTIISAWRNAHRKFVRALRNHDFSGIVVDYDGTLCDTRDRDGGWPSEVADCLIPLLKHHVELGVATGRGDSARRDLRRHLPVEMWNQVWVAYYNGAVLALLSDDLPKPPGRVEARLDATYNVLVRERVIFDLAEVKCGSYQISVREIGLFRLNSVACRASSDCTGLHRRCRRFMFRPRRRYSRYRRFQGRCGAQVAGSLTTHGCWCSLYR